MSEGRTIMINRTLPQLFEDAVGKYPDNVLLWEKHADKFEAATYARTRVMVREFASGLISLSIKKGDRVALIAEGRTDWVVSELGILFAGAVDVPISVKIDLTEFFQ
jgi:long-chain acyl-CoA synthetase